MGIQFTKHVAEITCAKFSPTDAGRRPAVGVDSSICLRESRRDPLHLHACLPVFSPFPAMASPGSPEPVIQGKFELWQQFSIKRIVEDVFRGDTMHRT